MTLYIIGAGGVGREAYDAALAGDVPVTAFAVDEATASSVRGVPLLAVSDLAGGEYVVAIADPNARLRLANQLDAAGLTATTLIHPRSIIAPETTYGAGLIVLGQAHISSSVTIGTHCQVHYNTTVGHDTVLADRVTVYPGANVSGSVQLGADVTIGSNAVVLQGLTVGDGAFVGAGAVVTRNVAAGAVVVGSPARPIRSG